jgi:dipeptidyl-peptidase 4
MRIPLFLVFLLSAAPIFAQGSAADYERARTLGKRFAGKVRNASLVPHWLEGEDHFWYRRDLGQGRREYRFVSASDEVNRPLVEAAILTKALGRRRAERMKLHRVQLDKKGALLWFDDEDEAFRFEGDAAPLREPLEEIEAWQLPLRKNAMRSSDRGGRSFLRFLNRRDKEVEFLWVDRGGQERSYGKIAPGQGASMATFAGHAWKLVSEGEALGYCVAEKEAGVVLIGGKRRRKASRRERGRREKNEPGRRRPRRAADRKYEIEVVDHDLYLKRKGAGERKLLSDVGEEGHAFSPRANWSPDGRYAVVRRTKVAPMRRVAFVESSPRDQLQPRLQEFNYRKPGDELDRPTLWLVDGKEKRATEIDPELYPNPYHLNRLHWEADSEGFRFLYNERGHGRLRVIRVEAKSAKAAVVIDEDPDTFVDYAGKFYLESGADDGELIWMSERSGWNHLYRIDARSGRVLNAITSGEWVVRGVDRIDRDRGLIWFRAGGIRLGEDPYHVHHARVRFDGSDLVVLTEGDGTHEVSYSPSGAYFVDRWSRVDLPPRSVLRRSSDGSLVAELETADVSALKSSGWTAPERFVAKGRDGETDIWGIIHRPTNFDPKRRYPVVEQIYAGPHGAHVPKSFRVTRGAQATAELGFVVVQIDGMGTSQRSKAFHDVCWKNLGDAGFPDRIAWMKAAAASRPWMDTERVGIYGGSAGGQNAMRALIAHHDFYDVAVADCGCHDNRMDKIWWNELWMSWPIGPHYAESSNVDQAHRLKGDLLLIVGELDRNVDPASTMQVVDALVKANKDFEMLVIPGAGHGAAGTSYGRRRQRDFLVRKLHRKEPRW